MYEVSVEHSFTAGHAVSAGRGALEEPHEHVWRMTAVFRAESLDGATGMVIDFTEVDKALRAIADELQGKDAALAKTMQKSQPELAKKLAAARKAVEELKAEAAKIEP